jgi:hypothetical protein
MRTKAQIPLESGQNGAGSAYALDSEPRLASSAVSQEVINTTTSGTSNEVPDSSPPESAWRREQNRNSAADTTRTQMPNRIEDDFRVAFDRAIEGTTSSDELLSVVRALVCEYKRQGRQPESVLVTLKELCGLSRMTVASDTDSSLDSSDSRKLSDMVVTTAIDEYYTTRMAGRQPWKGYVTELEEQHGHSG